MPLLTIILVLLAVGVLLAVINLYGPPYIDPKFLKLINAVAVIGSIVWLLAVFGVWDYLKKLTV
jgi:hypothetical protein